MFVNIHSYFLGLGVKMKLLSELHTSHFSFSVFFLIPNSLGTKRLAELALSKQAENSPINAVPGCQRKHEMKTCPQLNNVTTSSLAHRGRH